MSKNYWQSKQSGSGPASETGKQISSRNATKHGCCSTETLILASENIEEFKSLESTWFRAYEPTNTAEVHLVHQLTQADWFLQRAIRNVAQVEAGISAQVPDPLDWTPEHHQTLARFLRYQTTHTNTVIKRRKAVEDFRKNRAAEATRVQTSKDKAERQDFARTRLKLYQEKSKPKLDWDENLQEMRRKAIRLGFVPPPNPTVK